MPAGTWHAIWNGGQRSPRALSDSLPSHHRVGAHSGTLDERISATAATKKSKGRPSPPPWAGDLPERTLFLMDGFGYIFRAYYSRVSFVTRDGVATGAFTVFGNMLLSLLGTFRPRYLAVIFESRTGNVRSEILPEIKANRTPPPDDLISQIPLIESLIAGLGIPVLSTDGYEADDTIAALAREWLAQDASARVLVMSADKDLLALVSDRLGVYDPMTQKLYGPAEVREKWGVDPDQISDLLALTGDGVDNIGGVPGIGPKTAATLLSGGLHIEDLVTRIESVRPEKLRPKILEHRDLILRNKSVTVLHDRIGVDARPEALALGTPRLPELRALARRLEAATLLSRIEALAQKGEGEESPGEGDRGETEGATLPTVPGVVSDPVAGGGLWDGTGWKAVPPGDLCRALSGAEWKGQDYWTTSLTSLLRSCPSVTTGDFALPSFDMELAGYLVDPGRRDYRLSDLRGQFFLTGSLSEGEPSLPQIGGLLRGLEDEVERLGVGELLRSVEIPVARILVDMEKAGIPVDPGRISKAKETIEDKITALESEITREAGQSFSILSPKQVGEILYGKLGLPPPRRTGKGTGAPSTDEEALEALAPLHPLPRLILSFRQLRKFLSTYLLPMEEGREADGRLHGQFNQTVAATGRLSSSRPNLQNIPARTELGRLVRRCFVAPPGTLFLSADYSQVELRLLAHLSKDPFLLDAFTRGDDIHARTAALLFGEPVTAESRRRAKTINFGILYGMSAFSLSQDLGVDQASAQEIIDRYFSVVAGVMPYFEGIREEAKRTGRIRTILGRIRPIPEIRAENRNLREYGERMAVNSVLQGSAADLVKKAMVDLVRGLAASGGRSRLLLQVHDELLLEVPESEAEQAASLVRETMEAAIRISVPLPVSIGRGTDWVEAHPS
ncbi:MAG: DNA polymerase [Leptospirales bacterium]